MIGDLQASIQDPTVYRAEVIVVSSRRRNAGTYLVDEPASFDSSAKPAAFGPPAARHFFTLLVSELTVRKYLHFYSPIAALPHFDNGDVGASLILLVPLDTMLKFASAT